MINLRNNILIFIILTILTSANATIYYGTGATGTAGYCLVQW